MADKIEIEVPEDLSDITLQQYQEWVKIVEATKDLDESKRSIFLDKSLVEIFCKLPLTEIAKIKATEFSKILEVLSEAFTKEPSELITRFKMDGVEYGFEPNLQEMLLSPYIDTEAHIVSWDTLHVAMAALYRPVTHERESRGFSQYEIEPYSPTDSKSEAMLDIPLDVAMSARVFFCDLGKELSMITLAYLEQMKEKEQDIQQVKTLEKSGDGINQFIHSLEEMHSNLTKQLPCHYIKL